MANKLTREDIKRLRKLAGIKEATSKYDLEPTPESEYDFEDKNVELIENLIGHVIGSFNSAVDNDYLESYADGDEYIIEWIDKAAKEQYKKDLAEWVMDDTDTQKDIADAMYIANIQTLEEMVEIMFTIVDEEMAETSGDFIRHCDEYDASGFANCFLRHSPWESSIIKTHYKWNIN